MVLPLNPKLKKVYINVSFKHLQAAGLAAALTAFECYILKSGKKFK